MNKKTVFVKGSFSRKIFTFAGLFVILFASFIILNGCNLTGINNPFNYGDRTLAASTNSGSEVLSISDPNVKIENGAQVVNMNQEGNGYNPNRFIIQKGIPVKWVINSIDQNSCAVALVLSEFGINTILSTGENVIEFTPKETGEIRFACSMGMYTGRFIVIDENADSAAKIIKESDESAKNSGAGCCCSGGA